MPTVVHNGHVFHLICDPQYIQLLLHHLTTIMSNDPLEQFRQEWRQEIQERTLAKKSSVPDAAPPPHIRRSPIDIYAEAVDKEQRGELDAALDLYRRAFRLDPNVDRAYHYHNTTESLQALTLAPIEPSTSHPKPEPIHVAPTSTHSIHTLISAFPPASELTFSPEDERQPVAIAHVPDELLIHILRLLDVSTIERFALVCRRARVLTVEPNLWRDFVISTYVPPQIPTTVPLAEYITRFDYDMRRLYIELPRVRLDGVYIAVCHCNRPGQSENLWANVDHLVTYHRYLRFLPDGRVLSLLDQNLEPREAVHLITPDLVMKGFFIGTWTLQTSNENKHHVSIANLTDPSGKFEHSFRMELTLASRPLGRWNRLTFESYMSVNSEGTPSTLPIRNERPFWFSKVRSWA
ncbi:putative F-box protein pof7, related protein [Rhizoctonia solani 123E]|uniref:Putative F-box protein pof7, related protein n=1 Tax=Rhizoctonia solani 123E TaxID=1423351 RepID=A0A074RXB1_9AGAM|nr:putative F-box protein pof7, related protein [Rhizoctonia solani 123E]